MAMNRAKEGLLHLGSHDLAQRQTEILEEFRRRHPDMDDIPLRGRLPRVKGVQREEIILTPLSAETQKLVEQMGRNGYAVYETTGVTPASLRADGMRYWLLNDKLADLTVPPALLAFRTKPSEFFLPGSHNISHDEQVKLIPAAQERVDKDYPGAGLVVREGKLPEWTELALKHFKTTNVRIFGRDYGYNYTWTDTYENEQVGAAVRTSGDWPEANGAHALLWGPGDVVPGLGLAPLVEIPRK